MVIHLDTSFVVDLLREERRDHWGPASRFLEHRDDPVAVSVFVACELQIGVALAPDPAAERRRVDALLHAATVVAPDDAFAERYGALVASMRRTRRPVDTMDLLIAATALGHDAHLVTGNRKHFERIPGLRVLSY